MALKLRPRQAFAQVKSYGIAARAGKVRHSLGGACAASLPLGKVLDFDPNLELTLGLRDLAKKRDLLKQRIIDVHGYKDFKTSNILLTNGTYEANFFALSETIEEGDEIVVIRPAWYQFAAYDMNEMRYYFCCGGLKPQAKAHLLTAKEEDNWRYDVEGLKEVITAKTALIVVNSPNNPAGNVCTADEMRAICEIAKDYGAYVLHDEVYRGTEWDKAFSSAQAVNYYEKAVATNSFSKLLGWDNLRLGWLATRDKRLYERCRAVSEWTRGSGGTSNVQLEVGLAALEPNKFPKLLEHGRNLGKACWDEMDRWMSKHKDVFNWKRPMGGFLSFPSYNLDIGSWEFCEKLAAEPYSTSIIPGIAYGFEKHLRLGIGRATPEEVRAGMEQVGNLISALKK